MAARTRETNRWDAVINGVNYRLARKEGAYRKVASRSLLEIGRLPVLLAVQEAQTYSSVLFLL